MIDITPAMNRYRECARHIWNIFFRELEDGEDLFINVDVELFAALVLAQVGRANDEGRMYNKPIPYLRVILEQAHSGLTVLAAKQAQDGNWYWKFQNIQTGQTDLRFIDFFDWDQKGFRDWQYYRARIVDYPQDPELVGFDLLIERLYARIFFEEWTPSKSPPGM